jgi:DNA mismatch endonuclease (patch repair protein)
VKKRYNNYSGRNFKKQRITETLSVERRSGLMRKIRSKQTKFEQIFIVELKKEYHGKFKTNVRAIRGKPDIVFVKQKLCIFLDSDFWHGWQFPRWKHLLKNDFWREKIDRNRKRDRNVTQYLKRNGWHVLRFWGHDIKRTDKVTEIIKSFMTNV